MKTSLEHLGESLFDEIGPLAQESWDECSEIKKDTCSFHGERGFKIQPNKERYLAIADAGQCLAFTMRDDDGALQGYSVAILYASLHHAPVQCVGVDTFYLRPPIRGRIRGFVEFMESNFRERGVVIVGWPVSPDGGLFEFLGKNGYAPDDVVMEKRINALQHQTGV
jgi:hypothetical protein